MRIRFLLLCCSLSLLISPITNAEIYKTVDKKGHTVYTDLPPANTTATPVELPDINTLPRTEIKPNYATPVQQPDISYLVSITSPTNGATLMPNERNLNISVSINNQLAEGHSLRYFVDGKQIQKTLDTSTTLVEPDRGEHKLLVKVMDEDGKSFGESDAVTFLVMRPIAKKK